MQIAGSDQERRDAAISTIKAHYGFEDSETVSGLVEYMGESALTTEALEELARRQRDKHDRYCHQAYGIY
jgi:hypothetical protein